MPLVLFPDLEAWLVQYLDAALKARGEAYCAGVVVDHVEPNPRPPRSVVFRDDGGPQVDAVRRMSLVGVNVWAETEADAADLANMVAALLRACPDGRPVTRVRVQTGPLRVADEAGQPRRYLVAEFTVRGSAA